MWTIDAYVEPCSVVLDIGSLGRSYRISFGIKHAEFYLAALIAVSLAERMYLSTEFSMLLVNLLMDEHTFRAVIERGDADIIGQFEPNVAIEATQDVEVARLGSYIELLRVVTGN